MGIPSIGDNVPKRRLWLLPQVGSLVLRVLGWKIDGVPPDEKKFVIVAAPHTSNWDFVIGLAVAWVYSMDAKFVGKHTLFRWPMGAFMRWAGGIPLDREKSRGFVNTVVDEFNKRENLIVAITPEGTRKRVQKWKTGFYHIANEAQVPIALGFLDYGRKVVGFGPAIWPTGNIGSDLLQIQEFYNGVTGKHPAKTAPAIT